jgi:hypothetical protein
MTETGVAEAGSGIEGLRPSSKFAEYVAGKLKQETFKLVDVGCAGGFAPGWRAFGERLSAIGFDTNAEEVARLNRAEHNPKVRYAAGWVGMPDGHPLKTRIGSKAYWHHWPAGRLAYERTLDLRRARQENREPQSIQAYVHDTLLKQDWSTVPKKGFDLNYAKAFEVFAPSETETAKALEDKGPDAIIHLPPYLKAAGFYDADFLKLDIDGPDFEVLRSITDLLSQPSLLGVSVEVCFFGSHDANDHSFHNMDRLMREKGFDLFGLSVRTYASAALPFPYLDIHPSMNTGGRPGQGDALYIRDLGSRVRAEVAAGLSDEQLAKTAALFALFTLPDYAAEILLVHRERLSKLLDVDHALDLLAAELQCDEVIADRFTDYVAAFEKEDPRLFDRYAARNTHMTEILTAAGLASEARAKVEAAQARVAQLERELDDERRNSQLLADRCETGARDAKAQMAAVRRSTSWRVSAPVRLLARLFGR